MFHKYGGGKNNNEKINQLILLINNQKILSYTKSNQNYSKQKGRKKYSNDNNNHDKNYENSCERQ